MGPISSITVWLVALLAASACAAAPQSPAPLNESQQDRVQAAAHFATAKTLYEQGDLLGALHGYQRAWRWDPAQPQTLSEIVPLAASLGQEDVAIRYALIQADQRVASPEMLRRLALHATQQEEWRQAARLYHLWLEVTPLSEDPFQRALIQIERGRLELRSGDPSAASRAFAEPQRQLLEQPNSDLTRRLTAAMGGSLAGTLESFGRCHLEANQPELAAQAFTALAEAPDPPQHAAYWLARLALDQRQPLEAYALLWSYLDAGEDSLGDLPFDLLRRTLVLLNDGGRLEEELSRLREKRPTSPYPIATLARRYSQQDRREQAREFYRQLIDAASPNSPMELNQQLFAEAGGWLIRDAAHTEQLNRLLPLLSELAHTDPLLSLFDEELKSLARDSSTQGQLTARLKVAANQEGLPRDTALAACRASLLLEEYAMGVDFLNQAIAQPDQESQGIVMQCVVDLIVEDQPALAVDALRRARAMAILPEDDADAWYYEANAQAMAGDGAAALAAARRAAELAPESAQFATQVAWVLYQADQLESSITEYESVIERFDEELDPGTREALREARMTLSFLLLQQGDKERSAELLLKVLDEFPNHAGALNDLGYQWADQHEHLQKSVAMLRQAVAAAPDNAAYLDSLGWAYFRVDRIHEALALIEKAITLEENERGSADPEILSHYGEVLRAAGRADAAGRAWRRALEQLESDEGQAELADYLRRQLPSLEQGEADGRPQQETSNKAP